MISDPSYTEKMYSSETNAFMYGGLLRFTFLPGDDGNKYFAEFDREGNVATPATPMEEIY